MIQHERAVKFDPHRCRPREEPAGCVARAAARAAKVGNGIVTRDDLRAAARRALRSLCAVRLCTQARPEPARVSGVLLEPWDDVDEWAAHFPPGAAAVSPRSRRRRIRARNKMAPRRRRRGQTNVSRNGSGEKPMTCVEIKILRRRVGAFVLILRVNLHAIDATPAR